jgi:hypothetical protein
LPFLCFVLFLSAGISPPPGACNVSLYPHLPPGFVLSTDLDALLESLIRHRAPITTPPTMYLVPGVQTPAHPSRDSTPSFQISRFNTIHSPLRPPLAAFIHLSFNIRFLLYLILQYLPVADFSRPSPHPPWFLALASSRFHLTSSSDWRFQMPYLSTFTFKSLSPVLFAASCSPFCFNFLPGVNSNYCYPSHLQESPSARSPVGLALITIYLSHI